MDFLLKALAELLRTMDNQLNAIANEVSFRS